MRIKTVPVIFEEDSDTSIDFLVIYNQSRSTHIDQNTLYLGEK